jgi:hypothetical protein
MGVGILNEEALGWECSSVVEHMLNMCKALSSISSTKKTNKTCSQFGGEGDKDTE